MDVLNGRAVAAAVGLGLVAGGIAVPFSRVQANLTPIVFDVVTPSVPVLIVGIVGFALANSVGEELLWRGALKDEAPTMPILAQYTVQAVSFGAAHWHGLPSGWIGCLLTAAASVLFLWIHRRWGISASILADIAADSVIFAAVLPLVLFTGWAAAN